MFDLEYLKTVAPGFDIRFKAVTGSTNPDLLYDPSARHGSVLIAGQQTSGHGRMSRPFASPEGGLYMSVLFEPSDPDEALELTPLSAVATAKAIEDISGAKTGIKWVNDVFIGGKKVSGILAEAEAGERLRVVLGIGVNVYAPEGGFPSELRGIAGALLRERREHAREDIAAAILKYLFAGSDIYSEYVCRSIVIGRDVTVHHGAEVYPAHVTGIDRKYRLIVECNGKTEVLDSGEVSVKL